MITDRYMLFAGAYCYPEANMGDFQGRFASVSDIVSSGIITKHDWFSVYDIVTGLQFHSGYEEYSEDELHAWASDLSDD